MRRPVATGRAFRLSSAATMLAGLPLKLSSIRVDAAGGLLDAAAGHDADIAELWRERSGIETGGMDRGEAPPAHSAPGAARRASG